MRLLGARKIYLEEFESLHRSAPPDLSAATDRLTECFRGAEEIWLPAAIGGHPDHRMTRDIGLRAAANLRRAEVVLYADYPYILAHGWPPSLTGQAPRPFVDADFWLTYQLIQAGLDPDSLKAELVTLNPEQRNLKLQVIQAYQSQAPVLSLGSSDLAISPEKLDYELCWRMAVPGIA